MARVSYPAAYDPEAPNLGLAGRRSTPCSRPTTTGGPRSWAASVPIGAATHGARPGWPGTARPYPDYYEFPENMAVRGRGHPGDCARRRSGQRRRTDPPADGVRHRTGHRGAASATGWSISSPSDGTVTGVVVDDGTACRTIRARGGVVFGSGGFAHSPELRERFLRGPIAGRLRRPVEHRGSRGHRHRGRRGLRRHAQRLVEPAGARGGRRLRQLGARRVGHSRRQHGAGQPVRSSGPSARSGSTSPAGRCTTSCRRRVRQSGHVHGLRPADWPSASAAVTRSPRRSGGRPCGDRRGRGRTDRGADRPTGAPVEGQPCPRASPRWRSRPRSPRPSRHHRPVQRHGREGARRRVRTGHEGGGVRLPRAAGVGQPAAQLRPCTPSTSDGPLFAISLVGTTFDTNSGPRIGTEGQILGSAGPIGGLYGAGNCVDGVFGEGYPGGGSTIGPGMVFGFLAGAHAGARSPRVGSRR